LARGLRIAPTQHPLPPHRRWTECLALGRCGRFSGSSSTARSVSRSYQCSFRRWERCRIIEAGLSAYDSLVAPPTAVDGCTPQRHPSSMGGSGSAPSTFSCCSTAPRPQGGWGIGGRCGRREIEVHRLRSAPSTFVKLLPRMVPYRRSPPPERVPRETRAGAPEPRYQRLPRLPGSTLVDTPSRWRPCSGPPAGLQLPRPLPPLTRREIQTHGGNPRRSRPGNVRII
jgi:hypothetical protein